LKTEAATTRIPSTKAVCQLFILGKTARLDVAEILACDERLDGAGDEELGSRR
jgi:hypothetical protein